MLSEFRRRFWLPPRAHGQVLDDRTVSFLELFYDLVYVVVVGRAAHHLAGHVSWEGVGEFAVVFGMAWLAWMNGTLYYELHGREDWRTRLFVFVQMLLLVLLAAFTDGAGGDTGVYFGIVYVLFLGVVTWLWQSVRRVDEEEYLAASGRYIVGLVLSMLVVAASLFLPDTWRLVAWAVLVIGWVMGTFMMTRLTGFNSALRVTDSLVERYGLFVIIVLGETIVGVTAGISEAGNGAMAIVTGLLALMIGFAYWWTYFDFLGRRMPREDPIARTTWLVAHMPLTMSIAAAGAAMVSLVEHAEDGSTPQSTAWLLASAVAVGLLSLAVQIMTLVEYDQKRDVFRPVVTVMPVAAGGALLLGLWSPSPWLLALSLVLVLSVLWIYAVTRWIRSDVEVVG